MHLRQEVLAYYEFDRFTESVGTVPMKEQFANRS